MKILSITLSDVRRFTSPITVEGLCNGVNVLTAPNESGKSTLFDALQAVFFQPYRSRSKEAKALQPHVGGKPTVSVEIELPSGRYRITKRWLAGAMAEVRDGARLIAKDDAAEDWIAAQLKADEAGGPAGLLWVRQGLTALDGEDKKQAETTKAARRDLLSSVAGEVEAMTGGRRMERARALCSAELGELITNTGRAKAGGPIKTAEDEVATLQMRESQLATTSRELSEAIEERRKLRHDSETLNDPEETAAALAAYETARSRHDEARRHADRVAQAADKVAVAEKVLAHALERRDVLAHLITARSTAAEQAQSAQATEARMRTDLRTKEATLATAEIDLKTARTDLKNAEAALAAISAAEAAERARKERTELDGKLQTARALVATIATASTGARKGPDVHTMDKLEKSLQDLRIQEALRDQAALRVTMYYAAANAPKVRLESGQTLTEATPLPLPDGGALSFDGIGRLSIDPGNRDGSGRDLDAAREAFVTALTATGAASAEEARTLATARAEAQKTLTTARATLEAIAPEGIELLTHMRAALGEDDGAEAAAPQLDRATTEAALRHATSEASTAQAVAEATDKAAQAARLAMATATAQRESSEERLADVEAALAGINLDTETDARAAAVTQAEEALADAQAEVQRLTTAAPDLGTAEATLTRAQSALTATEERLKRIDRRLAELDTLIALRAGEGVDEDLVEVRDQLAEARARLERYNFEREVLALLQSELDAARISAREHYFEPVTRELRPLLHVLWPDAELTFDDETILPTALTRNGQQESLENLSGGTREQIALLVRLAFARLLAGAGRAAPVILDDALVFSDDDRIERMFDTLHRQAGDMQLIVFSCRQRAFRSLGGKVLEFAQGSLPDEVRA